MKGSARRRTVRCGAIIGLVAAAELGSAGFEIGVTASAGLSLASTVTVSIEGAIGTWTAAPTQSSAAAPTIGTAAPVPPPDPAPDQPIVTTTPSTLGTTPSTPAGTTPVDAPSSSSEPEPTTP